MADDVGFGSDCGLTEPSTLSQPDSASLPTMEPVLFVAGCSEALGASSAVVRTGDRLELGRRRAQDGAHFQLRGSLVSRDHARITRVGQQFFVEDVGSRNGTAVDGRIVTSVPSLLRDGSILFVGEYVLVFRLVAEEDSSALEAERAGPLLAFCTRSPRLAHLSQRMRLLATSADALLIGETGVGKEVYARAMHSCSGRQGRFIAVNCAALPRDLAESELFGYVKGAHSQAQGAKRGLIQEASGGTLFLDEIGETSSEVQAKLLRFLQTREFIPLGSTRTQRVEMRVIAATNRDGDHRGIRADLKHRLGDPIHIPPLRRRKEDIPSLVGHFLRPHRHKLTTGALQALMLYSWPGNVRELENAVQRAVLLAGDDTVIDLKHLPGCIAGNSWRRDEQDLASADPDRAPAATASAGGGLPLQSARKPRSRVSREELIQLLLEHQGRIADVARVLDRRWQVVWKWLKSDGIDPNQFRGQVSPKDRARS